MGVFASLLALNVTAATPASAGTGLVPANVRTDLPVAVDGTVFDIEQMGNRILVAGSFTQVRPSAGEPAISQAYLYAYDIDTGQLDTNFLPQIDREIEKIVPDPDGSGVYVVGAFNNINDTRRRKIARLNADGTLDTAFQANADAKGTAVEISPDGTRLFVGGKFTQVNGAPRQGLVELNSATGAVAPGFTLGISGAIGVGGSLSVKAIKATPNGQELIIMSSSRFIGDEERWGLGKVDISGATAQMSGWRTRLFEDNRDRVGGQFWLRGFAMSPDGSFFVVTTSGGDRPPTNDVAIRFPVSGNADGIEADWITRNFDSTYSAAIDDDVVYIGGHFQYTEAPGAIDPYPGDPEKSYGFGGDTNASVLGDQVVARKQVAALDPATGHALGWNPGANGFNGVYELKVIDRGLLLGHDGDIVGDKGVGRAAFFDRNNPGVPPVGELDTSITSPITGAQFNEDIPVAITGVATAPDGVQKVQVTVFDLGARTWMQPDGTMAAGWASQLATLSSPDATESDWNLSIVLPEGGNYEVKAKTFDNAGDKDRSQPSIRITANDVGIDEPPETLITSAVVTDRDIRLDGTATDDVGVDRVRLVFILRDQLGTSYLQPDGTLGNYYAFRPTLTNPDQPGTNWSITVTVPEDGSWRMQAWAFDTANQRDPSKAQVTRTVGGDITDDPPSTIVTDTPSANAEFPANHAFTFAGSAVDDIGVDRVSIRIYNYATSQSLQAGGTIGGVDGSLATVQATLTDPRMPSTDWSIDVPGLPPGRYHLRAQAFDALSQSKTVVQDLYVLASPDEELPELFLTSPTVGSIADPLVNAAGTATDNNGVDRVELAFYFYGNDDQSAGWLRSDNATISNIAQFRDATLASPGSTATAWSYPTVDLPFEGRWYVRARVWDDAGQPSRAYVQNIVTFSPNDAPPTIEVDSLSEGDTLIPGPLALNGAIFDDQGVQRVRYYVRRRHVNEGPNPVAGTTLAGWFDAFVTQPGGDRSNFAFTTPDLEPGAWFIYVQGYDDIGQTSERLRINFEVAPPNNAAPEAKIVTPRYNSADPTSRNVTVAGTATDDKGVIEVKLLVYDYTNRGFLQADGSVTTQAALAYRQATLNNPGAASTSWTFSVSVPTNGRYYIRAVAYDADGMRQTISRGSAFWVTPGDALPDTHTTSPTNGATVNSSFAITGTATDDNGIERVEILIRNEDNRSEGLRRDGSIAAGAQWINVPVTPGASISWDTAITVPPGRWRIDVRSFDTTDKYDYAPVRIVTVP